MMPMGADGIPDYSRMPGLPGLFAAVDRIDARNSSLRVFTFNNGADTAEKGANYCENVLREGDNILANDGFAASAEER